MSALFNGTCPRAAIPDALPIPSNITYVVIPGQNASDPWMVACCHSYPVQIVENCWEWCQIDPAIPSNTSSADIADDFNSCLRTNHINYNESSSLMIHMAGSASRRQRASLLGSVLAAMVVSTALSVLW